VTNIIYTKPWTRVNDAFIKTNRIDASVVPANITHPLIDSLPNSNSTRYTADFYLKIGVDIVTETVFNYPYPFVTEKTLRPINCKRMFIVVGAPYTLKMLHSKGFVTFDDIIDESYDSIEDPEERFLSIVRSIEKFCALELSEVKKYYDNNCNKFNHNWHTLKNLKQLEIQQFISRC
jgi:hypothetical protein